MRHHGLSTTHARSLRLRSYIALAAVSMLTLATQPIPSQSIAPAPHPPIRRDSQALSVLQHAVSNLASSSQLPNIAALSVTGTMSRAAGSTKSSVFPFTYDSLFTQYGTEFRRQIGSNSQHNIMVSNHGSSSAANTGPHVPPGYYRYIFQPDYVPYALLSKAMSDPTIEVKYEENLSSGAGPASTIHISTASGPDNVARTLFVRHWIIDATTFLPLQSSVCLPTSAFVSCRLSILDSYESYQNIGGILSPSIVTSQVGDKETVTYHITGISFNPAFSATYFTIAGATNGN
jgi:hypothetical protein